MSDGGREHLLVTKQELIWVIDGLMVLMKMMEEIPENDMTEFPGMRSLLWRLMGYHPGSRGIPGCDR